MKNFKFIKDIVWYDGPLISLAIDEDDSIILEVWCDTTDDRKCNTYAHIYITDPDSFITSKKSYYQTIAESSKVILFEHDNNGEHNYREIDISSYLEKYGPQKEADLSQDLIEIKDELLKAMRP